METLKNQFGILSKVLKCLSQSLVNKHIGEKKYPDTAWMLRDARIKRFELSILYFYRMAKAYLKEIHNINKTLPFFVINSLYKEKVISEKENDLLIKMIYLRNNRNSYMGNEELAKDLDDDLKEYYTIMKDVSERLKQKICSDN